jgi:hypothetical protein
MGSGRQTEYTSEMGDAICALVSNGANLHRICKKAGYPSRQTVYKWLRSQPEFSTNYKLAIGERADFRFDRVDQVILDMRAGRIDYNQARVEVDALKWEAGREAPKKYGERVQLANDEENPVSVTLSQLLSLEELTAIDRRLKEKQGGAARSAGT